MPIASRLSLSILSKLHLQQPLGRGRWSFQFFLSCIEDLRARAEAGPLDYHLSILSKLHPGFCPVPVVAPEYGVFQFFLSCIYIMGIWEGLQWLLSILSKLHPRSMPIPKYPLAFLLSILSKLHLKVKQLADTIASFYEPLFQFFLSCIARCCLGGSGYNLAPFNSF